MEADVRTAIVTGGSHGIGRAIAKALARGYYTVAVLDRGKPRAVDGGSGRPHCLPQMRRRQ